MISLAKRKLGGSTAVTLVNSTATVSNPLIICPRIPGRPRDDIIVSQAFQVHTFNVDSALESEDSAEAWSAMFKSDQHEHYIETVLERSRGTDQSPEIICIRSEAEAQSHGVPNVWQSCNTGIATLGTQAALYICPEFLRRPQSMGGIDDKACPGVAANQFHLIPNRPTLFANRAFEFTKDLLVRYNNFDTYFAPTDLNQYMNEPLGWSAAIAPYRALSYLMYIQCGSKLVHTVADHADNKAVVKNYCFSIPDVTQPPWNFPPILNGSSLGNDSTSNINANATLAINLPQSLTSLASLVQGTPADSVGTS